MSSDRSYVAVNNAERARLEALVSRCTDADLGRALPADWTVAGVLAHLAFWDQRVLVLLERWRQDGTFPREENAAEVDWINDAGKPLCLGLAPRRAAELAVEAARLADRAVERVPDDFVARNAAAGSPINLVRATHRREHLDEIEQLLGKTR
jgi:hypothetical protein